MHLKSTNGPIDVLVCPEGEDHRTHSPAPTDFDTTSTSTPIKTIPSVPRSHSETLSHIQHHHEDLDVSLSSTADATGDDFEGFIDCESLEKQLDSNTLLGAGDMLSFESLSPPLQDADFCFGLDATEGIGELFDLV